MIDGGFEAMKGGIDLSGVFVQSYGFSPGGQHELARQCSPNSWVFCHGRLCPDRPALRAGAASAVRRRRCLIEKAWLKNDLATDKTQQKQSLGHLCLSV